MLAVDAEGSDAIAVREFGLGRIVGFHHAGNYVHLGQQGLTKREARRLFVDAVLWPHGCGPAFAKGERKQVCTRIANHRRPKAPTPAPLKVPAE